MNSYFSKFFFQIFIFKKILILIIFFFYFHSIYSESSLEIKSGFSVSDYLPELIPRYETDDLIAGGKDATGFGAINKKPPVKYYYSIFNPFELKYYYSFSDLQLLFSIETLGINGLNISGLNGSFTYSATGFFKGEGKINSNFKNTNIRFIGEKKIDTFSIGAGLILRNFQSNYEKQVLLYGPGFWGYIEAQSNTNTSSLYPGLNFTKYFSNGKLATEIAYLPQNLGFISSSGKIEQTGIIRFPADFLTGNLSNELIVSNYLYGDKKPKIHGMRFIIDYLYPITASLGISFCFDYDRIYTSYESYFPPAFFQYLSQNQVSGNFLTDFSPAFAETLSSYLIYKEPIKTEIRSIRLSAVIRF